MQRTKTKGYRALLLLIALSIAAIVKAEEACQGDSCPVNSAEAEEGKDTKDCECPAEETNCECQAKKEPVPESKIKNKEEFDEILNSNKMVILEYYSPQCGHCQKLQPEIDKLVVEGEVPIYQINCHDPETSEICQSAKVSGFPTIHFKSSSAKCDYNGAREADAIKTAFQRIRDIKLEFVSIKQSELDSKINELIAPLEQPEPTEENKTPEPNLEKVTILIVSSLLPEEKREEYLNLLRCESSSKLGLFVIDNLDLSEQSLIITSTLLHDTKEDREDELKARYNISLDGPNQISDLMDINGKTESFGNFEPMMLRYYLGFSKPFVFVLLNEQEVKSTENDQEEKEGEKKAPEMEFTNLEEIAHVFKLNRENKLGPLVIGLYMSASNPQHKNFISVLGMNDSFPDTEGKTLILSLDPAQRQFLKYRLESKTTRENVTEFLKKYENGELEAYYKSDPVPVKEEGAALEEVVGKTYESFIDHGNYKASVLITFVPETTSPNKATGKALEIAKELGELVKKHSLDNNEKELIKVGTFNVIGNEHKDITPQLKPQFKLFNKENPNGISFEEFTEKGIDGVKEFIKEKTGVSLVHVEEEIGEEL